MMLPANHWAVMLDTSLRAVTRSLNRIQGEIDRIDEDMAEAVVSLRQAMEITKAVAESEADDGKGVS